MEDISFMKQAQSRIIELVSFSQKHIYVLLCDDCTSKDLTSQFRMFITSLQQISLGFQIHVYILEAFEEKALL